MFVIINIAYEEIMTCPIMPFIRRFRPDLLNEAKLVGNDIRGAVKFLKKHGLWTKNMEITQSLTIDEERKTIRLICKLLKSKIFI